MRQMLVTGIQMTAPVIFVRNGVAVDQQQVQVNVGFLDDNGNLKDLDGAAAEGADAVVRKLREIEEEWMSRAAPAPARDAGGEEPPNREERRQGRRRLVRRPSAPRK